MNGLQNVKSQSEQGVFEFLLKVSNATQIIQKLPEDLNKFCKINGQWRNNKFAAPCKGCKTWSQPPSHQLNFTKV